MFLWGNSNRQRNSMGCCLFIPSEEREGGMSQGRAEQSSTQPSPKQPQAIFTCRPRITLHLRPELPTIYTPQPCASRDAALILCLMLPRIRWRSINIGGLRNRRKMADIYQTFLRAYLGLACHMFWSGDQSGVKRNIPCQTPMISISKVIFTINSSLLFPLWVCACNRSMVLMYGPKGKQWAYDLEIDSTSLFYSKVMSVMWWDTANSWGVLIKHVTDTLWHLRTTIVCGTWELYASFKMPPVDFNSWVGYIVVLCGVVTFAMLASHLHWIDIHRHFFIFGINSCWWPTLS